MEFYSRDKVYIRVITGVIFLLFLGVIGFNIFFDGINNFISKIQVKYFMAPNFVVLLLYLINILYLAGYTIIQLESSKYGMKKRVIDNYLFYPAFMFVFMGLNFHFILNDHYKLAATASVFYFLISVIIYYKAQRLRPYMYNDEVRAFLVPFANNLSWSLVLLFMSLNLMFESMGSYESSAFRVTMAIVQLLFIIALCGFVLWIFTDKIFPINTLLYLVSVCASSYLNGYFMPVGYLYFLTIIVILVIIYKVNKAQKSK
ncbi:hypothetical protein [Criibacterium bergeronii]|uniref:Tryptophan-rich sensory protein n=1 Tax=Criibacterium bergeronii TaxID=1871336 RepID=A0A371IM85_9FIRM|nr:hypothetical protein [Criibacterium bergeronii]MBS6062264.1 hypothetical protein [Peptostreptococcaceae bacterium]RDY21615.1 hypothetical protein BBG48_003275 [Criibacterium bergeronii]